MTELPVGQRYYYCYNCQTLHAQGYQCYSTTPVAPMHPLPPYNPWPQTYGPIPLTEAQVRQIFREELEAALRKYLNDGK